MSLDYTVRPISDRSPFTGKHDGSPFTATWADTLDLLDREIFMLAGKRVVIEVDVAERGIRSDGLLRADAKAATPAVRIAFESRHGPLVYATDRYTRVSAHRCRMDSWQHNVRAIALALEALRKVDRYGVSRHGEQYRGWKALGAGTGVAATSMTTDAAIAIIERESGLLEDRIDIHGLHLDPTDGATLRRALRAAQFATHPDRNGGDRSRYDAVDQARVVLQRSWGWS